MFLGKLIIINQHHTRYFKLRNEKFVIGISCMYEYEVHFCFTMGKHNLVDVALANLTENNKIKSTNKSHLS